MTGRNTERLQFFYSHPTPQRGVSLLSALTLRVTMKRVIGDRVQDATAS